MVWFLGGLSCAGPGVGLHDPLGSPASQDILWFYNLYLYCAREERLELQHIEACCSLWGKRKSRKWGIWGSPSSVPTVPESQLCRSAANDFHCLAMASASPELFLPSLGLLQAPSFLLLFPCLHCAWQHLVQPFCLPPLMLHPKEGNCSQLHSGDGFPHLSNSASPVAAVPLLCVCWRALWGPGMVAALPRAGVVWDRWGQSPGRILEVIREPGHGSPPSCPLAILGAVLLSVTSEPSLAGSRMPGQLCQAPMGCASAAQPVLLVPRMGWLWEAELAEPLRKSAFPGSILCSWRCPPACPPRDLQSHPALWCLLDEQGTGQDFGKALGSTRLEGYEEYQLPVLYSDPLWILSSE